jgi:septal ring factor EnvC (AmiA/AmiB activator)
MMHLFKVLTPMNSLQKELAQLREYYDQIKEDCRNAKKALASRDKEIEELKAKHEKELICVCSRHYSAPSSQREVQFNFFASKL